MIDGNRPGLWRLLNAFAKSSLATIWSGAKFDRRAEWMAASHPPGVPHRVGNSQTANSVNLRRRNWRISKPGDETL